MPFGTGLTELYTWSFELLKQCLNVGGLSRGRFHEVRLFDAVKVQADVAARTGPWNCGEPYRKSNAIPSLLPNNAGLAESLRTNRIGTIALRLTQLVAFLRQISMAYLRHRAVCPQRVASGCSCPGQITAAAVDFVALLPAADGCQRQRKSAHKPRILCWGAHSGGGAGRSADVTR